VFGGTHISAAYKLHNKNAAKAGNTTELNSAAKPMDKPE
jgi:hypothetical protein